MTQPRALAISPHLDDAVFSAGGTLAILAETGWDVRVLTVFTHSVPDPRGFALACQLDKGIGPEIDYMALRRAEDGEACAVLGARALHWPFAEAPHRGYDSAAALFGPMRDADEAIVPVVATALTAELDELAPTLLLAPQAIGGHVDHCATVLALLATRSSIPVLWWRDFPYVARENVPASPFAPMMAALPERDWPVPTAVKRAGCARYRSQLGYQFGGAEGLDRALARAGDREQFRATGALPPLPFDEA